MKHALFLASVLVPAQALAMQDPRPTKTSDSHMCYVAYKADDVVSLVAPVGHEITVQFSPRDHIEKITVSDHAHLDTSVLPADRGSVATFKAKYNMPPQPIFVYASHDDDTGGQAPATPRTYTIQWEAVDQSPVTTPPASKEVALAAAGDQPVIPAPKEVKPVYCYTVTYQYAMDDRAVQTAKWKAAAEKQQAAAAQREARKVEVELHQSDVILPLNTNYGPALGDAALAPTRIFDDYGRTQIEYSGNRKMPILMTVNNEGKESEIPGVTMLRDGVAQIQGVYKMIRARDGDLVLCMPNNGYDPNRTAPRTSFSLEPAVH